MKLINILAFYLPFEEFILKWLPVSDQLYLFLRQVPDVLVFLLMIVVASGKILSGTRFVIAGKNIDIFLFCFVTWACLTFLFNPSADIFVGIANLKALLRYVLLIYIILNIDPTDREINRLLNLIAVAMACQITLGIFQFMGGISMRDFLAARHVSESIGGLTRDFTGDRFEDVNDLMGTMGDTISYAYFLMLGLVLWIFSSKFNSWAYWLGVMVLFTLIYLTGSRSVMLTAFLLVAGHQVLVSGWRGILDKIIALLPLIITLGLIVSAVGTVIVDQDEKSFWYIFSGDYVDVALNQRLGILVYVLPEMLFDIHGLFGYSPDKFYFAEVVTNTLPMVPQILLDVLPYVLEDVYWIALYVYYGLIGLVFWLLFLFQLQKNIRIPLAGLTSTSGYRLSCISSFLLLGSIPLNLLNQAFEARSYSFYLWLFCGLALVTIRRTAGSVKSGLA